MRETATGSWSEYNQRYLSMALARVQQALRYYIARARGEEPQSRAEEMPQVDAAMPAPALLRLCAAFGLTSFERDSLLLCAGMDLEGVFPGLCAAAQRLRWCEQDGVGGDSREVASSGPAYPTFSLALAALPEAHWDALTPGSPLRRWQLISVGSGNTLTLSPLRIDEYILHYLLGISQPDERLAGLVVSLPVSAADLVPSQHVLVQRLVSVWSPLLEAIEPLSLPAREDARPVPVLQLCGEDAAGRREIAAAACAALDLRLGMVAAPALPVTMSEIDLFCRLWEREAILDNRVLLLDCDELDISDAARVNALTRLMQQLRAPLLMASSERGQFARRMLRPVLSFDVRKPDISEQRLLWRSALGEVSARLNGQVDTLVAQFNLSASAIRAASTQILRADFEDEGGLEEQDGHAAYDGIGMRLWDACRVQARPALEDLAQRIEPVADWHDLVLPQAQQQLLREIAAHVRQRTTVYEKWGFSAGSARGLGISALFAGASGTGKTLAAEVLAHELRLDLYRIDLSSVVSKYIGETEKNLRKVFDAAEEGGAILLFDEADALFGKRSEVKDSHDRYANIEVSYLLQRMEAYRGLAILTTNLKSALDTAFLRRIRFIVHFPFPDAAQRAEIWRHILPRRVPTEGLDIQKLARLNVAGGNIRNIALNAAFLAADAREPVRMAHMLRAASTEYAKLEKLLTEAEVGGWL
ncbi:MAG TPA: ATP-binding protein [Ktedonobacteraceae bacterium]|nr:ATP-binding protein [Ktedonobacteraceae bacterium]